LPPTQPVPVIRQNPQKPVRELSLIRWGADIEVDGSFVGNTSSDVQVMEGEHTVSVRKTGFKDWERKLKVSGGRSVHLNAELEKAANP
jgi:hypothetical protein